MDALSDSVLRPGLRPTVGLVLTGGGARSASQVGVLLALAEFMPRARNPFAVIVGTSAGAVAARDVPATVAMTRVETMIFRNILNSCEGY